jgi:hypothetical protein
MTHPSWGNPDSFPSPEDLDDAMRSSGERCLIEKEKTEKELLEKMRVRLAGVSLDLP